MLLGPNTCGGNTDEVPRPAIQGHRTQPTSLGCCIVPPAPSDCMDHDAQRPIRPPEEHDTPRTAAYYRTVDRILSHQSDPENNLAV